MSKVKMTITIDARARKMLDALVVQSMVTAGTRDTYSRLIEEAIHAHFMKNLSDDAKEYVGMCVSDLFHAQK